MQSGSIPKHFLDETQDAIDTLLTKREQVFQEISSQILKICELQTALNELLTAIEDQLNQADDLLEAPRQTSNDMKQLKTIKENIDKFNNEFKITCFLSLAQDPTSITNQFDEISSEIKMLLKQQAHNLFLINSDNQLHKTIISRKTASQSGPLYSRLALYRKMLEHCEEKFNKMNNAIKNTLPLHLKVLNTAEQAIQAREAQCQERVNTLNNTPHEIRQKNRPKATSLSYTQTGLRLMPSSSSNLERRKSESDLLIKPQF